MNANLKTVGGLFLAIGLGYFAGVLYSPFADAQPNCGAIVIDTSTPDAVVSIPTDTQVSFPNGTGGVTFPPSTQVPRGPLSISFPAGGSITFPAAGNRRILVNARDLRVTKASSAQKAR